MLATLTGCVYCTGRKELNFGSGGPLPAPTWGNSRWYNPSGFAVRLKHIRALWINRFKTILRVLFFVDIRVLTGNFDSKLAAAAISVQQFVGHLCRPRGDENHLRPKTKANNAVRSTERTVQNTFWLPPLIKRTLGWGGGGGNGVQMPLQCVYYLRVIFWY